MVPCGELQVTIAPRKTKPLRTETLTVNPGSKLCTPPALALSEVWIIDSRSVQEAISERSALLARRKEPFMLSDFTFPPPALGIKRHSEVTVICRTDDIIVSTLQCIFRLLNRKLAYIRCRSEVGQIPFQATLGADRRYPPV